MKTPKSLIPYLLSTITFWLIAPSLLDAQVQFTPDTSEVEETRKEAEPEEIDETRSERQSPEKERDSRNQFRFSDEGLIIYGSQLFQGDFGDLSFSGFNPNYQIGVGDKIQLKIWGSVEAQKTLQVDARGNIFIPRIGPVQVLGVRNGRLDEVIQSHIESVYSDNVESYAHLLSTQTAKVFVSGYVNKPGLYEGFSSDSPLYFLDRAGGVDSQRGGYLEIKIKRGKEQLATLNLYDFLREGHLPSTHFRDGDVILVGPRNHTVAVIGRVLNPARFEFEGKRVNLQKMLKLAKPEADATSATVRRAKKGDSETFVIPLEQADTFELQAGDRISVNSRNIERNLLIKISGEHLGTERIILPNDATFSQAIEKIEPSSLSNMEAIQIFRESVAARQKELLKQSLDNLERKVLSARSSSLEEAKLRKAESETILDFIDRAREAEPKGQIILESIEAASDMRLENNDIINIPKKKDIVAVNGEVMFPNTQTFREDENIDEYIERAGGFTEMALTDKAIIIRPNGLVETVDIRSWRSPNIGPGDEILILPELDKKNMLFAKEITSIIYQLALGARVFVGI